MIDFNVQPVALPVTLAFSASDIAMWNVLTGSTFRCITSELKRRRLTALPSLPMRSLQACRSSG